LFPVLGPYSQILDELRRFITNTMILRYRTDHPARDARQREVSIDFAYLGAASADTGFYAAGAAPKIVRTPETIALDDSSLISGAFTPIAAFITDIAAPFVHRAALFYRTTGAVAYSETAMLQIEDSLYRALIPVEFVNPPGVDYFITAADSFITVSSPEVDPALNPHQIAVRPNLAPRIFHVPVDSAYTGEAISVRCVAIDSTSFLAAVTLFYRKTGSLLYESLLMSGVGLSEFQGEIESRFVTGDGVDYYISATDNFGLSSTHGSAGNPHQVLVIGRPAPPAPLVIEAEDMQNRTHGLPCEGGWVLTHEFRPIYADVDFGVSNYWHFTVIAKGQMGDNLWPWLQIRIDSGFCGNCEISSPEWQEYSFIAAIPPGRRQLSLSFINDWYNIYDDRNLLLDKVIIEPRPDKGDEIVYLFEAEYMVFYGSGQPEGDFWKFTGAGYLLHKMYFEKSDYTFEIIAKGDSAYSGWPEFDVHFDGNFLGKVKISSTDPARYLFQLHNVNPGAYYVSVSYPNYVHKRYLYIDKFIFHSDSGGLLKSLPNSVRNATLEAILPDSYKVWPNYPNPFNPATRFRYELPRQERVRIVIYNSLGNELIRLADGDQAAGCYEITWDGLSQRGEPVPSGIYFCAFSAGAFKQTFKMLKLK